MKKYRTYYSDVKSDAKQRGIEFNLSKEYLWELYLKQNKKCQLTGLEINLNYSEKNNTQTASLDRINSFLGYTESNVQWVHRKANFIKMKLTQDELVEICRKVVENAKINEKHNN